jgi:hypothetical protein
MFASVTPSTPTIAPAGAKADCLTLANLLVLIVVQLLILWAESLATSLRERTETADLTDITRAFGTTDVALILERIASGLQRLRALEDQILRGAPGLDSDPRLNAASTAASPRNSAVPQPPGLQPASASPLSRLAPGQITAPPNRATGPPRPRSTIRKAPTGPVHPFPRKGMAGPVMPIPQPRPDLRANMMVTAQHPI